MSSCVIVAAKRTPIGAFGGALSSVHPADLAATLFTNILGETGLTPNAIDDVIMGEVLTAGQGQNPARQAALKAKIPYEKTATTINQVCGSGLKSVAMAVQAIETGAASFVFAGGMENMNQAPHLMNLRDGVRMGDGTAKDSMVADGLWCALGDTHMGITAENIANQFNISRDEQDEFAAASQQKAEAAIKDGRFKNEIVPIEVKKRKEIVSVEQDEHPRFGCTSEQLSNLRPAFAKVGTVTAGNASGINDGAAALLVTSEETAKAHNLTPLAKIVSWAQAGVDPAVMGTGPIPASRLALEKAGWTEDDLDLIEANEAFAAQAIAVNREMGWDTDKVNVNGGAIALGHPIGASGGRILVTLLHEMARRDAKKGLATLCIGGGMGIAMCVERP